MTVRFSADITGLANGISQAQGSVSGFGGVLAGLATRAGRDLIGMGTQATKMAGDFRSGMTSLVTGAGEAQSNLKMVSDGILKIATDTGTTTKQLSDGMYMIESAGFHGAAGLDVLKAAAEGAKVGNADLSVTASGLTTIMNDYHLSGDQAASAMSGLTATVAAGKTKLQDLAGSMGTVLPLASSLHIAFPQVAGAIATMTNAGMSAQRASQNLANAIRSLAAPGAAAQKSLASVGLSAQELKDTLANQGLTGAIQLIEDHVGKTFPAGSVKGVEAFKSIMGGATGYNVALMLGGASMQTYEGNVKSITTAMQTAGGSVQGWSAVQNTFNFKMDQAREVVETLGIKIGTLLLPIVGKVIDAFNAHAIPVFNDVVTAVTRVANTIEKYLAPAWKLFQDDFLNDEASGIFIGIFQNLWKSVQALGSIFSSVSPVIQVFGGVFKSLTGSITPASVVDGFITAVYKVADVVQSVTNNLQAFARWLDNGSLGAQTLKDLLIGIGVAIATIQIGAFVATIPALVAGFWAWATAAGAAAIATIAAAWPVYAIGLAIALLVAGILLAVQHWGDIVAWFQGVWAAFSSWFMGIVGAIGAFFVGLWNATASFFVNLWNGIVAWLQNLWQGLTSWLSNTWNDIASFFVNLWNNTVNWFQNLWQGLTNWLTSTWNSIASFFTGLWQSIGNGIQAGWNFIVGIVRGGVEAVVGFFTWLYNHNYYFQWLVDGIKAVFTDGLAWLQNTWSTVVTWLGNLWQGIVNIASSVWNTISSAIRTAIQAVWNWLVSVWTSVSSWLSGLWRGIVNIATSVWNTVSGAIQTAVQATWNWLVSAWTNVSSWLSGLWRNIANLASSIWSGITTFFTDLWNGTINWFVNLWTSASTWLQTQWNKLAGFAQTAWQNVSNVFANIWSTYIVGPLQSLWNNIANWFSQLATNAYNSGVNFINMLVQGIQSGVGAIWDAVVNIAHTIWTALGFHSPAKAGPAADSDTWMPNFINMLVQGLQAGIPQMTAAVNAVAQPLAAVAQPATPLQGSYAGSAQSAPVTIENHTHVYLDGEEVAHRVGNHMIRETRRRTGLKV